MFPSDPTLVRQKMTKSKFRMSQVGGHTPKTRSFKPSRTKPSNTNWILTASRENERYEKFGDLPELSSHCIFNGRAFSQSLRREYLKSRDRSVSTRMYRRDGRLGPSTSTAGSCFGFLKEFERKYLLARTSLSLSPLDEALAKLQSSQKCATDCVSLKNNDHSSMRSCESSVVRSERYVGFDVFDPVNSPHDETRCEKDPFDDIFEMKTINWRTEINDQQWLNGLFDFEGHKNCAVSPPPWCNVLVSTDSESDDSESISVQSKSSQLSVNTMNDELLCEFFGGERTPVVAKHSELKKEPCELVGNTDFEVNCTHQTSSPFQEIDYRDTIADQHYGKSPCESTEIVSHAADVSQSLESSSSNIEACLDKKCVERSNDTHGKIPSGLHCISGLQNKEDANEDIITKTSHSDQESTTRIFALQLPTPPDSSDDESDIEYPSDNPLCDANANFYSPTVEGVQGDADEAQSTIRNNSIASLAVEGSDAPIIAPLQLPTQFSDSSSDDESDEGSTLNCDQANADNSNPQKIFSATNVKDRNIDASTPDNNEELCKELGTDPIDGRSAAANIREMHVRDNLELHSDNNDDGNACVKLNDIVPLQLPTQEWSSSSDEESNCGYSSSHNNAYFSKDEEDDDDSCTRMPPPSSLKNITNISNHCSELVDSPISQHAIQVAATNMSFDDLTDTPVGQPRLISSRPRLSDGLTDTPHKTTDDSGDQKNLARVRKRLRTVGSADKIQTPQPRLSNGLTDTPLKTTDTKKGPKKLAACRKRLRPASSDKENRQVDAVTSINREERVKQRIKEKYRCRFLDTEAALDGSDEDSDEEDAVREIEEDESNNSFINDSSQLGYTQDDFDQLNVDHEVKEAYAYPDDSLLHRQFNHERNVAEQFKTPVFNRRMMRNSLSQNAHSSQRGLGNMNFIKSVLEHHRQGGDSDDIENEYHRFAETGSSPLSPANSPVSIADSADEPLSPSQQRKNDPPIPSNKPIAAARHSHQDIILPPADVAYIMPKATNQPRTLTAEQKAMIESKRVAALKRRQERMQQQLPVAPS